MTTGVPSNIDEAVETLIAFYEQDLPTLRGMTEDEFRGSAHYASGMFIRSSWYLWRYEEHPYKEWPVKKPALVQWFNERGVTQPDDMSDKVLRSLWRKVQE